MTDTTSISNMKADERREAARKLYRESAAAGYPLTGAELGEHFERGERWGRDRINEAKVEARESSPALPGEVELDGLPPVAPTPPSEPEAASGIAADDNGDGPAIERQSRNAETAKMITERQSGNAADAETAQRQTGAQRPQSRREIRAERRRERRAERAGRPSRRSQAWGWLVSKVIWIQYVGLLVAAAFGLFEVLSKVAGAPVFVAGVAAAAIELVGISFKLMADDAERKGEHRSTVRGLLIASGVVAVVIGATNAIGHAHIELEGGNQYVSAAAYGIASVAGYSLWTIRTTLAHRAALRSAGKIPGPGLRIPDYITDRYGKEVADRAEKLSRYDASLSVVRAVEQARAELDAEQRDEREQARIAAVRAAVVQHAKLMHASDLAADFESARFSDDELADMVTATADEHRAKRDELIKWVDSERDDAVTRYLSSDE